MVRPRPAAGSSACGRNNVVIGLTSILDLGQFLQFTFPFSFVAQIKPATAPE